jgi:hypothetical protein
VIFSIFVSALHRAFPVRSVRFKQNGGRSDQLSRDRSPQEICPN